MRKIKFLLAMGFCLLMIIGCDWGTGSSKHTCDFGSWTTSISATCDREGERVRYCDCGKEERETIRQLDHTWIADNRNATCDAAGYTREKCSSCGAIRNEVSIPRLTGSLCDPVHDCSFGSWITNREPTCDTEGERMRSCSCGAIQREPIARLNHNYNDWITNREPTCFEDGVEELRCSHCGNLSGATRQIPQLTENCMTNLLSYEWVIGDTGSAWYVYYYGDERGLAERGELSDRARVWNVSKNIGEISWSMWRDDYEILCPVSWYGIYPYANVAVSCAGHHIGGYFTDDFEIHLTYTSDRSLELILGDTYTYWGGRKASDLGANYRVLLSQGDNNVVVLRRNDFRQPRFVLSDNNNQHLRYLLDTSLIESIIFGFYEEDYNSTANVKITKLEVKLRWD